MRIKFDRNIPIVVRGGGDLATGAIYRLRAAGFPVLVLETNLPLAVRRAVSVCEAVYEGRCVVEDMECRRIERLEEFDPEVVNVLVDLNAESVTKVHPQVLIDAVMAKRNLGTSRDMAPITIATGPGFVAPNDVQYVVETKRGHTLGRVITHGSAIPNTGIPGKIMGYSVKRLLRAPAAGHLNPCKRIGDIVEAGEVIGEVSGKPVLAQIPGVVRGLIHSKAMCRQNMKIGDVDPRGVVENCFTISDKSLAVGGGVMDALMRGLEIL